MNTALTNQTVGEFRSQRLIETRPFGNNFYDPSIGCTDQNAATATGIIAYLANDGA